MQRIQLIRWALAPALLSAGLTGCSSTSDFTAEYTQRLTEATDNIERGELSAAHAKTIALIGEMEGRGVRGYEAQRALAEAVLVSLHSSAHTGNSFLTEPGERRGSIYGAVDNGSGVPSTTGHRLAAVFHAWHLLYRSEALQQASNRAELAPEVLQHLFAPRHAANYSWLVAAASLAELGFDAEAAEVLAQIEDPEHGSAFAASRDGRAYVSMLAVLEGHELPQDMQWQLTRIAYEIQKQEFEAQDRSTDPTLAYRLGCLVALGQLVPFEGTPYFVHSGETGEPGFADEFQRWVRGLEDKGSFFSSLRTPFRSGVTGCTSSGEPAIDFVWEAN